MLVLSTKFLHWPWLPRLATYNPTIIAFWYFQQWQSKELWQSGMIRLLESMKKTSGFYAHSSPLKSACLKKKHFFVLLRYQAYTAAWSCPHEIPRSLWMKPWLWCAYSWSDGKIAFFSVYYSLYGENSEGLSLYPVVGGLKIPVSLGLGHACHYKKMKVNLTHDMLVMLVAWLLFSACQ